MLPLLLLLGTSGCKSRGAVEIAAGKDNTCMRTEAGRVYCWGDDAYTQTKNPSLAAQPGKRTKPKRVGGLEGVRSISLAASHGCVITAAGGLQCFTDVDLDPQTVSSFDAVELGTFSDGVCARSASGEVKCYRSEPREIPKRPADPPPGLPNLRAIATGARHVCGIENEGTVVCFGDFRSGQLGDLPPPPADGTPGKPPSYLRLAGLKDVTAIGAGEADTCALKKDGKVACWGRNDLGQLGHAVPMGMDPIDPKPTNIEGLDGVTSIAVGYYHACAIVAGGAVKCWGSNHYGELGRPATKNLTFKPEPVEGITNAVQVACGEWHSCAALKGGAIKCWGKNSRGQLGNESTTDSYKPVEVKLP